MRLLGVMMGLAVVAAALWLAVGRRVAPQPPTPTPGIGSPAATAAGQPQALSAPMTPYEERRADLIEKRSKLVSRLQATAAGPVSCSWPEELDTLDLTPRGDPEAVVPALVSGVIVPDAYGYGIRRVRWFVRSDPPVPEVLRLVAETTRDAEGSWRTFWK